MAVAKVILNGDTLIDVTRKTVTSETMLSGTTALKNDGTDVSGTIITKSSVDVTKNGSEVTIPKGYYSGNIIKAVDGGSAFTPATTITAVPNTSLSTGTGLITITNSKTQEVTPTVTAGYISQGTAGTITVSGSTTLQLTSKAAATYYPSTADQRVSSGRYLTGSQTFKSVITTNLTAENIASGVTVKVGDANNASRILQITGTHQGGIIPTGTYTISSSGLHDVSNYQYASVAAGEAFTPATTITLTPQVIFMAGEGKLTISVNKSSYITPTITSGYISQGTSGLITATGSKVYQLDTLSASSYYPSTADQIISDYVYLTGDQTIKSVVLTNLTASNIVSGVTVKVGDSSNASRITQITGTYVPTLNDATITPKEYVQIVTKDTRLCDISLNVAAAARTSGTSGYSVLGFVPRTTVTRNKDYAITGRINVIDENRNIIEYYDVNAVVNLATTEKTVITNDSSAYFSQFTVELNGLNGVCFYYYFQQTATYGLSGRLTFCDISSDDGLSSVTVEAMPIGEISMPSEISASSATVDYLNEGVAFSKAITITPQLLSAGYISSVAASTVTVTLSVDMNKQPSYGWIPMSTDRVISSNTYVYGSQTIYGVSHNLSAVDIVTGKTAKIGWVSAGGLSGNILNITGTGGITPSGTITLSQPGIYDVTSYASAEFSDHRLLSFIQRNWAMQSQTFDTISRIGSGAFAFQTISSIYGQSVTRIENMAFYIAQGLRTVSFPLANYVGYSAFYSCNVLSDVYLPEVIDLYPYAFYSCRSLINIDLPKVTWLQADVFAACSRLATASFSQVTLIGGEAFLGCSSLTTANFSLASDIHQNAFSGCKTLVNLSFPVLKYIGNAVFSGCIALSSISFPECIRIGNSAFISCSNLQNISFPKVTEISAYAFSGCSALISVNFPLATSMSHGIFKDCTSLTTANFSEATYIAVSMFLNCTALTDISFPVVQTISSNAFTSCSALSFVKFSLVNTMSGYAFQYCTSLNTIILGNPNITPVNGIGAYTFSSCSRLLSVYLLYGAMISLSMVNAFTGTPISNVTTYTGGVYGSIYVPASLYDTYKSATNWITYSKRFVSLTDAQISALLAD